MYLDIKFSTGEHFTYDLDHTAQALAEENTEKLVNANPSLDYSETYETELQRLQEDPEYLANWVRENSTWESIAPNAILTKLDIDYETEWKENMEGPIPRSELPRDIRLGSQSAPSDCISCSFV